MLLMTPLVARIALNSITALAPPSMIVVLKLINFPPCYFPCYFSVCYVLCTVYYYCTCLYMVTVVRDDKISCQFPVLLVFHIEFNLLITVRCMNSAPDVFNRTKRISFSCVCIHALFDCCNISKMLYSG